MGGACYFGQRSEERQQENAPCEQQAWKCIFLKKHVACESVCQDIGFENCIFVLKLNLHMKQEAVHTTRPMTVEEYIEFEERSEIRHEFINGNLIPIPGTTDDHNEICFNLTAMLKQVLRDKGFRIYTEAVKAQLTSLTDYTYPDVMVTNDPRDLENRYIKKYPSVIFEVISKTSRIEDSADKFLRYKNIESLQNYILVDSENVLVEVRLKLENGEWEAAAYLSPDARFPVPALGLELELADIYEGVSFLKTS